MTNLFLVIVGIATLVAILSVFRNRLVAEIQAMSVILFGNSKPGIILYAIIMLPGTILHELSHWLVAEILRIPTGKITILPATIEDGEKRNTQNLGSVATGTADPFRGTLIGVAPFITGSLVLIILSRFLSDWWGTSPWWHIALVVYGLIVVGNSMLVSESDRKNWGISIGFTLILGLAIWQVGLRPTEELISALTATFLLLLKVLGLTASFILATIGASTGLRRLIERISHKKVMFSNRRTP